MFFNLKTEYHTKPKEQLTLLANQGDLAAKAELLIHFLFDRAIPEVTRFQNTTDKQFGPISVADEKALCHELLGLGKYPVLSHIVLTIISIFTEKYSEAERNLRNALFYLQSISQEEQNLVRLGYSIMYSFGITSVVPLLAECLLKEDPASAAAWFAFRAALESELHFISRDGFNEWLNRFFKKTQHIDEQTRLALSLCISVVVMVKGDFEPPQGPHWITKIARVVPEVRGIHDIPALLARAPVAMMAWALSSDSSNRQETKSFSAEDFFWIKEEFNITDDEFTDCLEKDPWRLMQFAVRLDPHSCFLFLNSLYLSHAIDLKTYEDVSNKYFSRAIPYDKPSSWMAQPQLEGDLPKPVPDNALHDVALCQLGSYLFETDSKKAMHYLGQISLDCDDKTFDRLLDISLDRDTMNPLALALYRKFKEGFVTRFIRVFPNPEDRFEKCIDLLTVANQMTSPVLFDMFLDYREICKSCLSITPDTSTTVASTTIVTATEVTDDEAQSLVKHAALTCSYLFQEQINKRNVSLPRNISSPLSQLMNFGYAFFISDEHSEDPIQSGEHPIQRYFENLKPVFSKEITKINYANIFQQVTLSIEQCWQDFVTQPYDAKTSSEVCSLFLAIRNILERAGTELDVHFNISEIGILTSNPEAQNGFQV